MRERKVKIGETMKGCFKVNELNKNGLFVSEMDWDKSYQDKGNPKGNFIMIVEPLEGFNKGIIYYQKLEDGFLIEGEGYILTGRKDKLQKDVSKWISEYEEKDFEFIETELR